MKFRQIINSAIAYIGQSDNEISEKHSEESIQDFDSLNWTLDILGQSPSRLVYPIHSPVGAHSEEYKTALQIAEEFDRVIDYKKRMEFWDTHYTVFGLASIIVFDTEKEVYGWHHGYPQGKLTNGLEGECFLAFSILPANEQELVPFMLWCLEKRRNKVEIPTIMDVGYYWKQIGKSNDPTKFLTDLIGAAEAHSNSVSEVLNPWIINSITDADAKRNFFYYGNQDAIYGETAGPFGSVARLFQVLAGIITCPLSTYGELFFQYDDGFHTAAMVGFLRGQKNRLDRGENFKIQEVESSIADKKSESSSVDTEPLVPLTNKHQKFLNEVDSIEKGIGENGAFINPKIYAPVRKLWSSLSEANIRLIRELYREEVKDQIDFAKDQLLNRLLEPYKTAIRQQPDKQAILLMEHRDGYVKLLTETYTPIQNWFYSFWDEQGQTVERVDDLEREVFYFCHESNKPFWVGRTLLHRLYGYCLVIEHFNKMLQATIPEVKPTSSSDNGDKQQYNISVDKWQPKIFISSQMQTRLFKTLVDYTPEEQREELEKLFTHGLIEGRVWIKLRADSLAYVFKQARESGDSPILADMRETARWLATYMRFGRTTPKDVSEATTYKVLRENLEVNKSNQIRLKA